MGGFLKALLEKISIEILFMTLFLFGASLFGLIFFTNQITLIFLVAYLSVSISTSYFVSSLVCNFFKSFKYKKNKFAFQKEVNFLSDIEKRTLFKILCSGEIGHYIIKEDREKIENLFLFDLITTIKRDAWGGYQVIVNPKFKSEITEFLKNQKLN